MCRIAIIILFALLIGAHGFAQSSFLGLTPGQNTRAEAERA
jgi:hypothetical protein